MNTILAMSQFATRLIKSLSVAGFIMLDPSKLQP